MAVLSLSLQSLAVKEPDTVCPSVTARTTLQGLGATVMFEVPVMPSLAALMTTGPGATADTRPVADTVAMVGAEELQVTARPASAAPLALRGSAVSCSGARPTVTVPVEG